MYDYLWKLANIFFDTQKEAIAYGREIAINQQSELRIQGKDSKFRESWSYGNDPYPPEG